jgi:hypothetical protein
MSGEHKWGTYSVRVVGSTEGDSFYCFTSRGYDYAAKVALKLFQSAHPDTAIRKIEVSWVNGRGWKTYDHRAKRVG